MTTHQIAALAQQDRINRRAFLGNSAAGLGIAALVALEGRSASAGPQADQPAALQPHFPARATRIIYLFQAGGPSQIDLFDPKPSLAAHHGEDLPDSIRMGQRLALTAGQARFPVAPSVFQFAQHGQSGLWLSELLPHTAKVADQLCVIRSMHTDAINHDPAFTFLQTGSQIAGRPSIGSWLAYGLGSENADLPAYVVLTSRGTGRKIDQPLCDRLWGAGFLSTEFAGVRFRRSGDPIPFLADPAGVSRSVARSMLDDVGALNRRNQAVYGDPEIAARIAQYELSFRMQTSVPELVDISNERDDVVELYGPEVRQPGTYAYNCLMARRLAERGVRFIQLFHTGWDQHDNCPKQLPGQCRDTDQPSAGLLTDLKQRGLLDDTLIVWGGEFGRTIHSQGELTADNYGRDHHPCCFTMWLAGGGVRPGTTIGATDDYSFNITERPIDVHDLHATILHLLGIDHTRLIFRFQGRDYRLTDVHGKLVREMLA